MPIERKPLNSPDWDFAANDHRPYMMDDIAKVMFQTVEMESKGASFKTLQLFIMEAMFLHGVQFAQRLVSERGLTNR